MPPVRIAATPGPPMGVARLDVPTSSERSVEGSRPVRIELKEEGNTAQAFDSHGGRWSGRLADIKPDLHWVLKRLEDGSFELRPVRVWYEFGRQVRHQVPSQAEPQRAVGSSGKRQAEAGVAELEREVGLCKELNNRWEAMVERRQARQGSMLTAAAAREAIRSVARRTPVEVAKPKGERAYPDLEERVKDDTGLRKQQKKKKKALHREARAVDEVEDEEVPDTANRLLQLKPEQGEGGWEFEDKEEFSDDDEEKWEFDDQLECAGAGAEAPSADEDEGEEVERDLLSGHGRNIEMLLQQHGPEGAEGAEGLGEADASSGSEASEPETAPPARPAPAAPPTRVAPAAPVVPAAPAGPAAPSAAAAQGARRAPRAEPRARAEEPPRAAVAAPRPAAARPAPRTNAPEAEAPPPNREQLRQRLIDCLRERGGTCRAQDAMRVLGLTERVPGSAFYKEVLGLLKEVTTVERAPGEAAQRVLVLKPQHRAR